MSYLHGVSATTLRFIKISSYLAMRLLNTTTFELHTREDEFFKSQGYAILSHRWVGAEVTFKTLPQHISKLRKTEARYLVSPQLSKIRGACEVARQLGFSWIWIDTCCINSESTVEVAESINSTYQWYRGAQICITYLSDVNFDVASRRLAGYSPTIFQKVNSNQPSEWFFRGWTLQELLVPRNMNFYDTNWTFMGTKESLAPEIEHITDIASPYLTNAMSFFDACIATKMSWMSGRQTTREEDIAYSMLGIFGVFMSPIYPEGGLNAFMRLQEELQTRVKDESLYAWKMPQSSDVRPYSIARDPEVSWGAGEWGLLAPTPNWFRGCGHFTLDGGPRIHRTIESFMPARGGTCIDICRPTSTLRLPAVFGVRSTRRAMDNVVVPLNCWQRNPDGTMAAVAIRLHVASSASTSGLYFKRVHCEERLLMHGYNSSSPYPERPKVVLQPRVWSHE
jgi:hypothetical protein